MKPRWLQWLLTGAAVVLLVPALLPLGRIYRLLDLANIPWSTVCGVANKSIIEEGIVAVTAEFLHKFLVQFADEVLA